MNRKTTFDPSGLGQATTLKHEGKKKKKIEVFPHSRLIDQCIIDN